MLSLIENHANFSALLRRLVPEKSDKPPVDETLKTLLEEAQADIATCRRNLAFTDDATLIDMYIYAIKAHELRFAHLLKLAKKEVS